MSDTQDKDLEALERHRHAFDHFDSPASAAELSQALREDAFGADGLLDEGLPLRERRQGLVAFRRLLRGADEEEAFRGLNGFGTITVRRLPNSARSAIKFEARLADHPSQSLTGATPEEALARLLAYWLGRWTEQIATVRLERAIELGKLASAAAAGVARAKDVGEVELSDDPPRWFIKAGQEETMKPLLTMNPREWERVLLGATQEELKQIQQGDEEALRATWRRLRDEKANGKGEDFPLGSFITQKFGVKVVQVTWDPTDLKGASPVKITTSEPLTNAQRADVVQHIQQTTPPPGCWAPVEFYVGEVER